MNKFLDLLQAHSKACYLVYLLIAVAGILAFKQLPSDVYPELSFPRIAVIATAGDASPERVLLTVTRVLEEAASQVYNVRWVRSKTIRGASELSVDFQNGIDMTFALHQLQARIAEVQSRLPAGVTVTVELVTPSIFPVISYNITAEALTQADLYTTCRYQLQPALNKVPGVARVQLQGGDIPQISVEVDPEKLKGYGVSLADVAACLQKTNQTQVVGRLDQAHEQNLIVASGESLNLHQIESLVLTTKGAANIPIYLKNLARVSPGFADRQSLVSIGQKRGLVVNIFRQPNSNVVALSRNVRAELAKIKASLPPGIEVKPAYDQSVLVNAAIANVTDAILIGIALIVFVLFVFLRSVASTFIAAMTIPLSVLAAFGVMYLSKQSLNLMSLGGVAIAIGLVIDDAIVVIENIQRQLPLTDDPRAAIRNAVSELFGPITSSTATTVVVFLPLALLSGVAGQFFSSLTFTLATAVIFSWLLALTLTPLIAGQLLRPHKPNTTKTSLFQKWYGNVLRTTLRWNFVVALLSLGIIFASITMYKQLPTDFLPSIDEGSYVLDYLAPPGASLADVDLLANKLETIVARTPEVLTWTRRTGAELGLFATQTNKGDILVVLKPASKRSRKIDQIMDTQREQIVQEIPQLDCDFHQILQDQLNDLSGAPRAVEIRLFGENPEILRQYAAQIERKLATVKGVVDRQTTSRHKAPEIDLLIDPVKASRIGLSPLDVATQVQDSILGISPAQIRQGDHLVDIRLRLEDRYRHDPQFLPQIPIVGSGGRVLPLDAVAELKKTSGELEIYCENQQRYVSVQGSLEQRDLGSAMQEIREKLSRLHLPNGYTMQYAGLYETQQQSFTELLLVLALAIVLVYVLLVIQFRSLVQPLAIFSAIPLALFGVIAALSWTNTPLNVSSFMGVILLIGLVVKNGIILLEYTNRLRASGLPLQEALVEAGKIRLRPIVMTTLCTLLGLLPLAVGSGAGAELQKPLAIAVIGGLSLSTLLTLIFVPVIFLWLDKMRAVASSD